MSTYQGSVRNTLIIITILAAITLLGVYLFDEIVAPKVQLNQIVLQTIRVMIILTTTIVATLFVRRAKNTISKKIGVQAGSFFEFILVILVVTIAVFNILGLFNIDTNTLLISGGIISLTVGLIVSTFVGDTLAGMLVFALNLFRVGDVVLVNNIPSRVEEMGALITRFKNDAGGTISVPNTAIAQGGVIITRFHHEVALPNRLPYIEGDRVYTTYMNAEGTVEAVDPIHTRIKLSSGMEIVFMNNSVLSGSVAVAKILPKQLHKST